MKTPSYDDTILQPLTTDALIEERVNSLIGKACRRQLWFLFLDSEQVQLPLMIPMDDIPSAPDDSVDGLARLMGEAIDAADARSTVVVIERFAGDTLTPSDKAWARAIHDAFEREGIVVRGILLSHRRGVRWIAQDDYRF